MCLSIMMVVCIKQHLSNIWNSIHEKVKQHWGSVEKTLLIKKLFVLRGLIMKCKQHVYRRVCQNLIENRGTGSYDINVTTSTWYGYFEFVTADLIKLYTSRNWKSDLIVTGDDEMIVLWSHEFEWKTFFQFTE